MEKENNNLNLSIDEINELENYLSIETKNKLKNKGTNLKEYIYNKIIGIDYDNDSDNEILNKKIMGGFIDIFNKEHISISSYIKSSIDGMMQDYFDKIFEQKLKEYKTYENIEKKGIIKSFFGSIIDGGKIAILLSDKNYIEKKLDTMLENRIIDDELLKDILKDIIMNNKKVHEYFIDGIMYHHMRINL